MNVYELVNSKDIRGYLEEIHYEFNTIQVVWLIYANKKLKYAEKKAAWSEVMETMPDQPVEHVGAARSDSIFKEVRKYIQEQDELIAELEKENTKQKYVYSCRKNFRQEKQKERRLELQQAYSMSYISEI